jgi:hypothetical protein
MNVERCQGRASNFCDFSTARFACHFAPEKSGKNVDFCVMACLFCKKNHDFEEKT